MRLWMALSLAALLFLLGAGLNPAAADETGTGAPAQPAGNSQDARRAEAKAAFEAAMAAASKGPADIPFLAQATLKLPAGLVFVPVTQSNRLMRAWGNSAGGDGFVGLVFSTDTQEDWFITASYVDAGYVKDAEAKNWDTDALLKNSVDGVAADNEDRAARGFGKIKVDGWIEKPAYDASQHRLIYSLALSDIDAKPGDETSVNFHTYALGREGYFALDLVTGSNSIDRYKDRARTVLAALEYKPGKGYGDYVASTDRVAEYGIAALIGGLAAKKLGLLALGGLAIAKFGKLIALGALGLFGGAARFFRRK